MRKREDGKNSQTVAKNAYNNRNYDRIAIGDRIIGQLREKQ